MNRTYKMGLIFLVVSLIGGTVFFIQNSDWLLHKQKSINVQKSVDGNKIKTIHVDSQNAHLQLHKSKDSQVQTHLSGSIPKRDQVQILMEVAEQGLSIKVKYQKGSNPFSISSTQSTQLNVSIPSKVYEEIQLLTDKGDIGTKNLKLHADEISLESSYGTIRVSDIQTNAATIKTQDEKIRLNNNQETKPSDPPMRLKQIDASDGNVTLFDLQGQGQQIDGIADHGINLTFHKVNVHSLALTMFSGKLLITDYQGHRLSGNLHETSTLLKEINTNIILVGEADITVDPLLLYKGSNQITSERGNIRVRLTKVPMDLFVSFQTEQGKIQTNLPIKKEKSEGSNESSPEKHSIIGMVGSNNPNGGANLLISTKEGNIQVDVQ